MIFIFFYFQIELLLVVFHFQPVKIADSITLPLNVWLGIPSLPVVVSLINICIFSKRIQLSNSYFILEHIFKTLNTIF